MSLKVQLSAVPDFTFSAMRMSGRDSLYRHPKNSIVWCLETCSIDDRKFSGQNHELHCVHTSHMPFVILDQPLDIRGQSSLQWYFSCYVQRRESKWPSLFFFYIIIIKNNFHPGPIFIVKVTRSGRNITDEMTFYQFHLPFACSLHSFWPIGFKLIKHFACSAAFDRLESNRSD